MGRLRWSCCVASLIVGCLNPPPPGASASPVGGDGAAGAGSHAADPLHDAGLTRDASPCGECATPAGNTADASVVDRAPTAAPARDAEVDASGGEEDDEDAGMVPPLGRDAGVSPNGRPPGVAECYNAASSAHAATQRHWDVFRRGDLAARGAMIEELAAAATAQPNEQEFALLLGLANLWRVAEPYGLESLDALLTLDSVQSAEQELERALRLCPTDHRIAAWLGPIKIRMGRMLEDAAVVDEGFAVLNEGIARYPGFVLFAKLLVYADLPATDPDFLKALDAVRENAVYCGSVASGLSSDPACHNHPRASHNIEGSAVFLGDMYAKAQDRAAALAAYQSAKAVPTWSSWDYQAVLEERIATLDERIAAAASARTSDDPEAAWNSAIQCSLCHRD